MCGFAGIWSPGGLEESVEDHLGDMIRTLRHRGPDGEGFYFDKRQGLGLAHARLTIIDLHGGSQPMTTADQNLALVVNGEFYDYKKIRTRLMADGYRLDSKSDSEIVLPLFRKYALKMMSELRGEFAFALYDRLEKRLLLVRDRFGIRPLFYRFDGRKVLFASEAKGILAHPSVCPRLDRRAALNQLMQTMVPGTSAFEGISAVPPGYVLEFRAVGERLECRSIQYWDLEFPERGGHLDTGEISCVDGVRERLIEAVSLRLEADVPVGCYLSGGIDSCSILGLATGTMQSPVKAFTISFASDDYDESSIASEMAHSMNADQDIIRVGPGELYGENFLRTVWHAERSFYNTLGVAKWCMSRHVRSVGYKTVVTGEGADELFGGYPAFKRDMFLHGLDDESESERRELERALLETNRIFRGAILAEEQIHHEAWEELCGFTPSWIQSWLATLSLAKNLLHDEAMEEIGEYDPVAAVAAAIDPGMIRNRHPLDRAQYTWSKTMLEGQILNWGGDRVDMANSMESRPAFLDHHLAEFATSIPPALRIKGNREKHVLREAVRGVLPDVLYNREKFAFMAPPAHTSRENQRQLSALIQRFLSEDAIREAGLFDSFRVGSFLSAYQAESDPTTLVKMDALLNHVLCLQILHAQYVAGEDGVWRK